MSITVSISAIQFHTPDVDTDDMSNSRHSPSLISISVGVDHPCRRKPTDLFVASHWLERSSSRFSVTLLVFSRSDHSTSQVITISRVVFISTFYRRLASKSLHANQTSADMVPRPWRHTAVTIDARGIQISSQNIRIRR